MLSVIGIRLPPYVLRCSSHNLLIHDDDDDSMLVIEFSLGKDSRIYSEKRRGLGPLLTQYDFYVYATERELALVLIDLGTEDEVSPKKELISD